MSKRRYYEKTFSKKIILYTIILILAILSATFIYYIFSTMTAEECINYCIENSERNATKFSRFGDGRYIKDYAYFAAVDGDQSKPQEIFVFRKKPLGFITLNRYKFIMSSTQANQKESQNNKYGSIEFFTRNDSGATIDDSTLLFFVLIETLI